MKDTRKAKCPVLFMLDEFFAIAEGDGLPVIRRNMAMLRGYGVKLWTVLQDLGQAEQLYGDKGFESFIGNAGVLQSFAPQDVITSEYLSKRTGQTTRQIFSGSRARSSQPGAPSGAQFTETLSLGQIPLPLMLPQDLRNLDDGEAVLFSHKLKGTAKTRLPYPTELRHLKEICALDPSG
jgi:type IV secretion system protein VirD4